MQIKTELKGTYTGCNEVMTLVELTLDGPILSTRDEDFPEMVESIKDLILKYADKKRVSFLSWE